MYSKKVIKGIGDMSCILIWVWIASWFLACWIFHWQLFFTGLFSLFLGYLFSVVEREMKKENKGQRK